MEIIYQSHYKNISNQEWIKMQWDILAPKYADELFEKWKNNPQADFRNKINKTTGQDRLNEILDKKIAEKDEVLSKLKKELEILKKNSN